MHATASPRPLALPAGLFYLAVIAAGLTAEFAIRQPLLVAGDPAATFANVAAALPRMRLGFALDTLMILADIGLAVLLFFLFRPVQPVLATFAMVFRLMQAAVLAAGLLLHLAAMRVAAGPASDWVLALMELQADGYDLGLIFFGFNCLVMAVLLARSGFAPRLLAALVGAAGVVYLAGSFARFLAPALHGYVLPAYAVPMLAELSFALWLLWFARRGSHPAPQGA
ncbi:DUF4386 domain-containing protein [Psychromarinibacter sp. C21-152]|uniref:DUF4386 domain-containing protein n=1 Tax=Psychromarinibacter sediminicola TaxID=3033385 RepID=A0AAE3T7U6_9RHOB|nr:DUF4386 domain-containing protein [Psychromarinibacter sediminicola]MDF0600083.1 DUF4386 domain-containing protein [Psychromarinibacter sediminicola]